MTFFFGVGEALDAGVGEGDDTGAATRRCGTLGGGVTFSPSPVVVISVEIIGRSGGLLLTALAESIAGGSLTRLVLDLSLDIGAPVPADGLFGEALSPPRTVSRPVEDGAVVADETFSPSRRLGRETDGCCVGGEETTAGCSADGASAPAPAGCSLREKK